MKDDIKKLLWLDLEMTGLDPNKDVILEAAAILTDFHLNVLDELDSVVVAADEKTLSLMNEKVAEMHNCSGLTSLCKKSKISLNNLEEILVDFLKRNNIDKVFLAGNSIYNDLAFIRKYLINLLPYLHYRLIDVSTIKELAKSWYGIDYQKENKHRALEDIQESIQELKFYRENIFN